MDTVVGIRGAIVARENSRKAILEAARNLLERVIHANDLSEDDIAGVFFTSTIDLTEAFPATALTAIGWLKTAALCAQEIDVPESMKRVIRVMIFANVKETHVVRHQYIGEAAALRPDRTRDQA